MSSSINPQNNRDPKLFLTKVFCTSGLNLVVLAWTGDELSRGQAQNGVNFDFEVKFDLDGQGQSPPQNYKNLNQGLLHIWSKFGDPSLMSYPTDKLVIDAQTHTHRQTQATTIPRVKKKLFIFPNSPTAGLNISKNCHLPDLQNWAFFPSVYIKCKKKLSWNPLAWLVVLLDPRLRAMGYVKPWGSNILQLYTTLSILRTNGGKHISGLIM